MISSLIETLLGASACEADVIDAYSLEHGDFLARPHLNTPDRKRLAIRGDFYTRTPDCTRAGEFARTIYASGGKTVAKHDHIFVAERFRRRGIAKAHLRKILRFYDRFGIEYVHLDAVDWGPVVWPQFGFDFHDSRTPMAPLHDIFRVLYEAEQGQPPGPLPDRLPPFSLSTSPSGGDLGAQALREYSIQTGNKPITLVLDLRDKTTRTFLGVTGIL